MDLPELYILRHGETEWNAEHRMQGVLDLPLTAKGRAQAVAMGRMLAAAGVTADSHAVISSPQGRARITADLVAKAFVGQVTVDARLREISVGEWGGLTRAQIEEKWPAARAVDHFLDFYAMAPGGDGFDAMWTRAQDFLRTVTAPTIVVTHGITSRVLRTAAMGYGIERLDELPGGQGVIFRLANGEHTTLGQQGLQP